MRVNCLAQEHNAVPRSGLEPGPFDPESSAPTISLGKAILKVILAAVRLPAEIQFSSIIKVNNETLHC